MNQEHLQALHFSSKTDEWSTPQEFFDKYDKIYKFTLDVCATHENAKVPLYITKEVDALTLDWSKCICWMNPPYGRQIKDWVKKAYESNTTVVCLLPARTDTKWFHDYCLKGKIEFIKGRLKFGGAKYNAPFPSMVVIFEKRDEEKTK